MTKVYITKWALTGGIEVRETASDTSESMIRVILRPSGYGVTLRGPDWHLTAESAVIQAQDMQRKKLTSLGKTINRVRTLAFTKEDVEALSLQK